MDTDTPVRVSYKGSNPIDAGMFYCPYIPYTRIVETEEMKFISFWDNVDRELRRRYEEWTRSRRTEPF